MGSLWQWHGYGGPVTLLVLTLAFGLGVTLLALWIALPFAVFGVKSALRDLLAAQRETNRLLAGLGRLPEAPLAATPSPAPPPETTKRHRESSTDFTDFSD